MQVNVSFSHTLAQSTGGCSRGHGLFFLLVSQKKVDESPQNWHPVVPQCTVKDSPCPEDVLIYVDKGCGEKQWNRAVEGLAHHRTAGQRQTRERNPDLLSQCPRD